jgi:hypothetical protein
VAVAAVLVSGVCMTTPRAPEKPWSPPFASDDTDLVCPTCGAGDGAVQVRAQDWYRDGDQTEAYCIECHAMLELVTAVEVEFSDPEVVDG